MTRARQSQRSTLPRYVRVLVALVLAGTAFFAASCSSSGGGGAKSTTTTTPGY